MATTQNIQKIRPYERLAVYYDRLMDYIDYDIWVDDIELLVKPFEPGPDWLDISCGTGSMAIRLAKRGHKLTAVDLSPDMVDVARKKASEEKVEINFAVSDMTSYKNDGQFDVIINLHDGLNYLLKPADTQAFMDNSYALLKPGGTLLFDVVTPLLCQRHFRGYREIFTDEMGGYERHTTYDPDSQLTESSFTLKTEDEDTVEIESHIQRAYELDAVETFCKDSAFDNWQILDDETLEQGNSDSERYLVILRKQL